MTGEHIRVRGSDLSWEQLDDELVILDLRGSTYLRLNGSGMVLWKALVAGGHRQQLIDALVDAYEIDQQTAAVDVEAFVATLSKAGLLEGRPRR